MNISNPKVNSITTNKICLNGIPEITNTWPVPPMKSSNNKIITKISLNFIRINAYIGFNYINFFISNV